VYALAEFPVRAGQNIERRYLAGRYGALPVVSQQALREALWPSGPRTAESA
jgi:hypothetical protein